MASSAAPTVHSSRQTPETHSRNCRRSRSSPRHQSHPREAPSSAAPRPINLTTSILPGSTQYRARAELLRQPAQIPRKDSQGRVGVVPTTARRPSIPYRKVICWRLPDVYAPIPRQFSSTAQRGLRQRHAHRELNLASLHPLLKPPRVHPNSSRVRLPTAPRAQNIPRRRQTFRRTSSPVAGDRRSDTSYFRGLITRQIHNSAIFGLQEKCLGGYSMPPESRHQQLRDFRFAFARKSKHRRSRAAQENSQQRRMLHVQTTF